jgi:hypothetical protein
VKIALVTVSHAPDLARCALLAESVDRFVSSEISHTVVVSRRDHARFATALPARTRLAVIEPAWPWPLVEVPRLRLWVSPLGQALPVRGWILQQLVKLSAPELVDADLYVFTDSDVAFVRPLDRTRLVDESGRALLVRCPNFGSAGRHRAWQREAARLLGLADAYTGADYVGNLIPWRRDVLLRLRAHIERATGRPWRRALANTLDLSEYVLYGVYCDRVLGGAEAAGHVASDRHLCHALWEGPVDDPALAAHAASLRPDQVAVLVQSRLGVAPADYARWVRALWETTSPNSVPDRDS